MFSEHLSIVKKMMFQYLHPNQPQGRKLFWKGIYIKKGFETS